MVRGCYWGYLQTILKWVLYLAHKWANLMACAVEETKCMLSTLLRWASYTGVSESQKVSLNRQMRKLFLKLYWSSYLDSRSILNFFASLYPFLIFISNYDLTSSKDLVGSLSLKWVWFLRIKFPGSIYLLFIIFRINMYIPSSLTQVQNRVTSVWMVTTLSFPKKRNSYWHPILHHLLLKIKTIINLFWKYSNTI